MSEIECQGTVSMAAGPTPAEIIAKLCEDMTASPVDGVTVIDRGQLEVLSAALTPPPQDHVVPPELCQLTFAIQHNPNCPSPWLVRLPGKGPIDMLPYGDPLRLVKHLTGDVLGFGKTLEEAARAALKSEGSTDDH